MTQNCMLAHCVNCWFVLFSFNLVQTGFVQKNIIFLLFHQIEFQSLINFYTSPKLKNDEEIW